MGCDVVTVSPDTQFVHLAWQADEKALADANFSMGADPTGFLHRMFNVLIEEEGLGERGTFIIDPDGIVANIEVNHPDIGRNIDELMRKFKANLYLSKKTTEGCPSKWKEEGDVTLKPSEKMVGKVHEALANEGNPA